MTSTAASSYLGVGTLLVVEGTFLRTTVIVTTPCDSVQLGSCAAVWLCVRPCCAVFRSAAGPGVSSMRGCGLCTQSWLLSLGLLVGCPLLHGWSLACPGERVEVGALLIIQVVLNSGDDASNGDGADGKVEVLLLLPWYEVQNGHAWVAPGWCSVYVKSELTWTSVQQMGRRVGNLLDPDQCKADRVVCGCADSILYRSNAKEATTEIVELVCANDQGEVFFPDLQVPFGVTIQMPHRNEGV